MKVSIFMRRVALTVFLPPSPFHVVHVKQDSANQPKETQEEKRKTFSVMFFHHKQ